MTAITESLPVDRLQAQAREVRPGRAVATALLWVFVAFGWVIGWAGRSAVLCAVSVRYGVLRGYGLTDAEITGRAAAKARTAGPGG